MIKNLVTLILVCLCFSAPAQMLLNESSLPEYEGKIDHKRLLQKNDKAVHLLGRGVYELTCLNCHGDAKKAGSVPNALRFGIGKFQHGNDPYTMYQTLTRGWRMMAPQMQLTPREKYAVIHYIRNAYLKKHNPQEYFKLTDEYLESLPKGKELGPKPVKKHDWEEMDYGTFQIGSYEIATAEKRKTPWPKGKQPDYVAADANIAYKGIAIRLDKGPGGVSKGNTWLTFEHDTMRIAGVWTGGRFIDWNAIHFNGRHVDRPRTMGTPIFETADGPGWANPATASFEDARFRADSGQYFGPFPKKWMNFKGIYRHGDQQVINYSVGDADILESHELQNGAVIRHLNIAKSSKDLKVRLANAGTKISASQELKTLEQEGFVVAKIKASNTPLNIAFTIGGIDTVEAKIYSL